jgi:predicted MFS family arabinose efflux permease
MRVMLLAAALGLQTGDVATVSATADDLQRVFGINNTDIGLLVSVTSVAGPLGTVPIGVLSDRTRRVRLLAVSIALWAVAMIVSGAATSFRWLLLSRVVLGVVTATTGPTIASLTGDYFPAGDRARLLGYILGGELIGTGIGFVISGEISALVGWRFAFWWLAIPSVALAWLVWRLPEPARGGQSRLQPGGTGSPRTSSGASTLIRIPPWCSARIRPSGRCGGRSATCCGCAPTWCSSLPRRSATASSPLCSPSRSSTSPVTTAYRSRSRAC